MCDRVVYEDSSLKVYSPNKYITHKMCDEAVDGSLAALSLIIPDWLVTSKMIKKSYTALHADKNILHFD